MQDKNRRGVLQARDERDILHTIMRMSIESTINNQTKIGNEINYHQSE